MSTLEHHLLAKVVARRRINRSRPASNYLFSWSSHHEAGHGKTRATVVKNLTKALNEPEFMTASVKPVMSPVRSTVRSAGRRRLASVRWSPVAATSRPDVTGPWQA
jgi:hypothetical protein